jgi:hypothetical protein
MPYAQKTSHSRVIWAIRLHDDQTEITNDDVYTQGKDLRGFFNISTLGAQASSIADILTDHDGNVLSDHDGNVLVQH